MSFGRLDGLPMPPGDEYDATRPPTKVVFVVAEEPSIERHQHRGTGDGWVAPFVWGAVVGMIVMLILTRHD